MEEGGGCSAREINVPPLFSISNSNLFLATELKRGKEKKIEVFSKRLFGWCKNKKNENLRFVGHGVEACELSVYRGGETL